MYVEELMDNLERYKDATQKNTFIYYDTNIAGAKDIRNARDATDQNYMLAGLELPPTKDDIPQKGFLSIGALAAFAILAMGIAQKDVLVDLEVVYRLLAALQMRFDNPELQKMYIDQIRAQWEKEGWAERPMDYLTSGALTIRVMPINIDVELGDYYREEAAVARAL